jgi:uncharacterized protein YkwD
VPRKLLSIVAIAVAALAVPASAHAGYRAQRVATAHVALGSHLRVATVAKRPSVPAVCANADLVPNAGNLDAVRAAILCLHNQIRDRSGMSLLTFNGKLRQAAEGHSAEMVQGGYFEHTSPSGSTMVSRILASGFVRADQGWLLGENLEWGTGSMATPRGAVDAWMNSAGHRANILNRGFRQMGIGISLGVPTGGSDGVTVTVDFGTRR